MKYLHALASKCWQLVTEEQSYLWLWTTTLGPSCRWFWEEWEDAGKEKLQQEGWAWKGRADKTLPLVCPWGWCLRKVKLAPALGWWVSELWRAQQSPWHVLDNTERLQTFLEAYLWGRWQAGLPRGGSTGAPRALPPPHHQHPGILGRSWHHPHLLPKSSLLLFFFKGQAASLK